jgi:hypothetical protein
MLKWSNSDYSPKLQDYTAVTEDSVLVTESTAIARLQFTADEIDEEVNRSKTSTPKFYELLNQFYILAIRVVFSRTIISCLIL